MKTEVVIRRNNKFIVINSSDNRKFKIAVDEIADNRATYYAKLDKDTTYKDEYDFTYNDDDTIHDWLLNNMDWHLCKTLIELPVTPIKLSLLEIEHIRTEVMQDES